MHMPVLTNVLSAHLSYRSCKVQMQERVMLTMFNHAMFSFQVWFAIRGCFKTELWAVM